MDHNKHIPRHVAVIMDGNGRWAQQRSLPRSEGHRQGVEAVRRMVRAALEFGVEYLTIFSFSTENWLRPQSEIRYLFMLLRRFFHRDVAELHAAGVKIEVIGDREGLEPDIAALLEDSERLTRDNTALTLVVAFNYGGRQDMVAAMRSMAADVARGTLCPEQIDSSLVASRLFTHNIPDPDLLIRTSGEQRVSNFLLWQLAYSEFVFVPELWPDFSRDTFARALDEFAGRTRRFGGLTAQAS